MDGIAKGVALWVRIEAKPGQEAAVEAFLREGVALVRDEPATMAWYAVRLGPSTYAIFDVFPDEAGRQAHLDGEVAARLTARASEMLARPPEIVRADLLAANVRG